METIYKWNMKIPSTKYQRDLELETLTYYSALSAVYDTIMLGHRASDANDKEKSNFLQQLNASLRQIKNIDVLCSLLEDIFQLLFLRWEHLSGSQQQQSSAKRASVVQTARKSSLNSSGEEFNEVPTTPVLLIAPPMSAFNFRHGFVCSAEALWDLLNFLKTFVTKRLHLAELKQASERIRQRFQRIVDLITEALWKYSVLQKVDASALSSREAHANSMRQSLDSEDLIHMVVMH